MFLYFKKNCNFLLGPQYFNESDSGRVDSTDKMQENVGMDMFSNHTKVSVSAKRGLKIRDDNLNDTGKRARYGSKLEIIEQYSVKNNNKTYEYIKVEDKYGNIGWVAWKNILANSYNIQKVEGKNIDISEEKEWEEFGLSREVYEFIINTPEVYIEKEGSNYRVCYREADQVAFFTIGDINYSSISTTLGEENNDNMIDNPEDANTFRDWYGYRLLHLNGYLGEEIDNTRRMIIEEAGKKLQPLAILNNSSGLSLNKTYFKGKGGQGIYIDTPKSKNYEIMIEPRVPYKKLKRNDGKEQVLFFELYGKKGAYKLKMISGFFDGISDESIEFTNLADVSKIREKLIDKAIVQFTK